MGCAPSKSEHRDQDFYLQPDLDIEAYHFHHFVRDLIKQEGGVQTFLNSLFLEWPIPDPRSYQTLKRYGHEYETWPQTHTELLDTIDRIERAMTDTLIGDPLRAVAAYLKGAATMKELINKPCEARADEITWPDIQFIFRQMLPQIKDKNDNVLLEPTDVPMLNPRVSLRYRVPKHMISDILEGEWRVYHKLAAEGRSYGLVFKNVTAVAQGEYTFEGSSPEASLTLKDGRGFWNEHGNSGVRIVWTEQSAGGVVPVQARLKVNGKFECLELQEAEVKKGSRVDNFPADPAERQGLKYFEGQPANTSQVSSTPAVEEEPASVAIGQGTPDVEESGAAPEGSVVVP